MSIFSPEVMDQPHGYANFASFGADWLQRNSDKQYSENPFNDPDFCEERKNELTALLGVSWIYGGWMEDRSIIWSDTYLKDTGAFLHLGIDITVPAGTLVHAVASGEILHVGTDVPFVGGWGGHVVQRIVYQGKSCALIYAHLGTIQATEKTVWEKGSEIGAVGDKDENGHWSPHLHVQIVRDIEGVTDWQRFLDDEIDGYGKVVDIADWARRCPDPTSLIFS